MSFGPDPFTGSGALAGYNGWTAASGAGSGAFTRDGSGNIYSQNTGSGGALKQTAFSTTTPDVTVTANLSNTAVVNQSLVLLARGQSNGACYGAGYYNGKFAIVYYGPGFADSQLVAGGYLYFPSGAIEFDVIGTSPTVLTVKVNGTTQLTYSDNTYNLGAGWVGVGQNGGFSSNTNLELSAFAANDPDSGGPLSAGTLAITGIGSTTLPYSVNPSGGTGPYTRTFQTSANGTSGWTSLSGEPNTNSGILTGLTAASTFFIRVMIVDSASSPATAYTAAVEVTTLLTINATDSQMGQSKRQWVNHPSITGAIATGNSGAATAIRLVGTGNIYAQVLVVDSAVSHVSRHKVDYGVYSTHTLTGGTTTTIPILVSGTVGTHDVTFEAYQLDQGSTDLAGLTGTPSCFVFLGYLVDPGTTTAAYPVAMPTGNDLIGGCSYIDSGGVPGPSSIGMLTMKGLGTWGGSRGQCGQTWSANVGHWGSIFNQVTKGPYGISFVSGGVLAADSVALIMSRNDGGDVSASVQAAYTAFRAVYSGPFFIGPDCSIGGGYSPENDVAAASIYSQLAAIQAATPDQKLIAVHWPAWAAEGLDAQYTAPTFNSDGVHPNQETVAYVAAYLASFIATQKQILAGGGGTTIVSSPGLIRSNSYSYIG